MTEQADELIQKVAWMAICAKEAIDEAEKRRPELDWDELRGAVVPDRYFLLSNPAMYKMHVEEMVSHFEQTGNVMCTASDAEIVIAVMEACDDKQPPRHVQLMTFRIMSRLPEAPPPTPSMMIQLEAAYGTEADEIYEKAKSTTVRRKAGE